MLLQSTIRALVAQEGFRGWAGFDVHGVIHSMNRVTLDRTLRGHHRWSAATAVGSKRTLCVALVREPSRWGMQPLGQTTQQRTLRVAYIVLLAAREGLFFGCEAFLSLSEGLFCLGEALLLVLVAFGAAAL